MSVTVKNFQRSIISGFLNRFCEPLPKKHDSSKEQQGDLKFHYPVLVLEKFPDKFNFPEIPTFKNQFSGNPVLGKTLALEAWHADGSACISREVVPLRMSTALLMYTSQDFLQSMTAKKSQPIRFKLKNYSYKSRKQRVPVEQKLTLIHFLNLVSFSHVLPCSCLSIVSCSEDIQSTKVIANASRAEY